MNHRQRGKTTKRSALDGAVFDCTRILAYYLVHGMSRSQLYLGFGHFVWLFFSVNNILVGLLLNCIWSVEITLFILPDILLQHRALFPVWRPGHTALYGLITAKTRQKVVPREADDVVRVDVEFKTSNSRFIDVVGRGEKSERCRTR